MASLQAGQIRADFMVPRQTEAVLARLRHEPRHNLLLMDLVASTEEDPGVGIRGCQVVVASRGAEIVGVASLRPSLILEDQAGPMQWDRFGRVCALLAAMRSWIGMRSAKYSRQKASVRGRGSCRQGRLCGERNPVTSMRSCSPLDPVCARRIARIPSMEIPMDFVAGFGDGLAAPDYLKLPASRSS